jgi:phosphoglycolate phosphatase-like HAD superfamily hydrolase
LSNDLSHYDNLILDCDGVVLDSNFLKEKNIFEATLKHTDFNTAQAFSKYFTDNNGLPRAHKIITYFGDTALSQEILSLYNHLNEESLLHAPFTFGFEQFLDKTDGLFKRYVLSGGDESELLVVFNQKAIAHRFEKIMGAPKTKYEHLYELNLQGKTLYIGDSKLDYDVALKFQLDFIFMSGYTQFTEWRSFFSSQSHIKVITNLSEFILC